MITVKTGLRWNIVALALAGPALLGTLLFILARLKPATWCGVLVAGAKEGRIASPECTSVLLALLSIHRDAIWILGGTLGIVLVAIGLSSTGMSFRGKAFGGEASLGADDDGDRSEPPQGQ